MAAVNIKIQGVAPFDCKGNSSALRPGWKKWLESFQHFLVAKGVVNDVQKALLLHTAGIEAQELYETLNDPGPREEFEEDTATDFQKVVSTLNAYFVTKLTKSILAGPWLNRREKPSQFMAPLRKQAQNCNFANPDVDIRDPVIDKCRSSEFRRKLLAKEHLTLQKVQEVA